MAVYQSLRQRELLRRMLRRAAKFIPFLFVCIVLPFVFVEAAMIVMEPYFWSNYQYDPDIGFRVRPYYGGTNRFGFNDKDYPLEREAGTFRVLIVGDSFNWYGGANGNYTAVLEEKLSAAVPGRRVEVINAGYPGTHTGEQLLMLRKYGLQYEPDLVVLGFFAGNDFVDADPNRKRIIVNDVFIDIDKRSEKILFGYPIVFRSRFLLLIQQKYKIFKETYIRRASAHGNDKALSHAMFTEDTFLVIERNRMSFCNLDYFRQGKYAPNIGFIFSSLREMRDLLRARGTPLIVAIFPDQFQVEDQLAASVFDRFKLDPKNYDLALMQKVLIGFLGAENIPYVDMLARFRDAGAQRALYLVRNTHWNDEGNRLAATILEERLTDVVKLYFESGVTIVR